MILLDTNVVSAVMARLPAAPVVAWLDRQDTLTLFVSAVTIAEIQYGLEIPPDGKRRRSLEDRFARFVADEVAPKPRRLDSVPPSRRRRTRS
jgi:hypothetical protein